jgi:hypothetical protein
VKKTFGLTAIISICCSITAFGLSSYEVKLQLKFLDGTSAEDTIVTEGNNWVIEKFGENTVKLKVEAEGGEAAKTTFEVTGPGEHSNQSQMITRLDAKEFASIESKDEESGKIREIKLRVKKNTLDDSER